MTENNVSAQAGDEPMRAAFENCTRNRSKLAFKRGGTVFAENVPEAEYVDPGMQSGWLFWQEAYKAAQVSPRATADVERNAKRQAERVERLVCAAKVYTFNYLQDEHEEPELCTCGPKQHAELVELFAALAAIATTKPGA